MQEITHILQEIDALYNVQEKLTQFSECRDFNGYSSLAAESGRRRVFPISRYSDQKLANENLKRTKIE